MLFHKIWFTESTRGPTFRRVKYTSERHGWFLFGIIPLYIKTVMHSERVM